MPSSRLLSLGPDVWWVLRLRSVTEGENGRCALVRGQQVGLLTGTCPIMCPHPLRSSFWGVKSLESEERQGCFSQGRHGWVLLGAPSILCPWVWEDVYLSHNRRNGGLFPLLRL